VIDKDMMVLQNNTNSEDVLVGPYGETYPACYDADQALNIKAEEVSAAEEKEDPVPKTIHEIKAEPEVSCMCMSTLRQILQICSNAHCLSDLNLSVSVCTQETTTVLIGF
jgi:hypothetical protein